MIFKRFFQLGNRDTIQKSKLILTLTNSFKRGEIEIFRLWGNRDTGTWKYTIEFLVPKYCHRGILNFLFYIRQFYRIRYRSSVYVWWYRENLSTYRSIIYSDSAIKTDRTARWPAIIFLLGSCFISITTTNTLPCVSILSTGNRDIDTDWFALVF